MYIKEIFHFFNLYNLYKGFESFFEKNVFAKSS